MTLASTYPKILIIGQQFDKKSGSGITMTNLFTGWDKNNIAVAASEIDNPDYSVCEKYYNIGNLEIEREFPFNLKFIEESSKSGILPNHNDQINITNSLKSTVSKSGNFKDQILLATGQIHRRRRFILSKELLNWINEFSPDIIYTQLSSLELIRFISMLHKEIKKPLVIHIMDDWPITITNNQKFFFKFYWAQLINKELKLLFNKTNVLLSISESMSEEYKGRYGRIFVPFHNPIDLKNWQSEIEKDYSLNGNFKILYAGRIGTGLQNCLLDVAYAINSLINKGLKIEFQIQATNVDPILEVLGKFNFVTLRSPAPYFQLPQIFSTADLLLLPNDFDKKSVSFLRYSMPTKASEYMVSGTPILVFSSAVTAVTRHALRHKWAYVVSENSNEKLQNAITELYADQELRETLGSRAKEFALINFNSEKIRAHFKNAILNYSQPE
jgi:glycosyltransferase involved in cell wall biosynthesis